MPRMVFDDGPLEGRSWEWKTSPPMYFTAAPFPHEGAKAFQSGFVYKQQQHIAAGEDVRYALLGESAHLAL